MKTMVVILLVAVLAALASAGVFMLRRRGPSGAVNRSMARALAWRVALSVAVFLLVLLGWALGWLQPGGIAAGR